MSELPSGEGSDWPDNFSRPVEQSRQHHSGADLTSEPSGALPEPAAPAAESLSKNDRGRAEVPSEPAADPDEIGFGLKIPTEPGTFIMEGDPDAEDGGTVTFRKIADSPEPAEPAFRHPEDPQQNDEPPGRPVETREPRQLEELPDADADDVEESHLFQPIESRESVEAGLGPRPLLTPGETLPFFGVPDGLTREVDDLATQLRPVATLGMSSMPRGQGERGYYEHRGINHVLPLMNRDLIMYVKGVGSDLVLEESQSDEPRDYAGYPATPDNMLLDDVVTPEVRPRPKGTLSAITAAMEQVNASAIFGALAKKRGWEHVSEAIDGHVTIPLGALELPGLSRYIGHLTEQYIESGENPIWRESLQRWGTNNYLATSALLVPSSDRILGGIDVPSIISDEPYSAIEGGVIGNTLRQLAGIGFGYNYGAAHKQNVRRFGDPAQADSGDLIAFGDFGNRQFSEEIQAQYSLAEEAPASTVQMALMYLQFVRGQLTPQYAPRTTEPRHSWEQTIEPQIAFWQELLADSAHPDAIARIPHLSPQMHTEIEMAAVQLLYEQADQTAWQEIADQRRQVIASVDPRYQLGELLEMTLEGYMSDTFLGAFAHAIGDEQLALGTVINYLKTGDERYLQEDSSFAAILSLQAAIENVADPDERDRLLELLGTRSLSYEMYNGRRAESVIEEFGSLHRHFITSLLEQGKTEDAIMVAEILATTSYASIRHDWALGGGGEEAGHHYARRVLDGSENLSDLLAQAEFDSDLALYCRVLGSNAQNEPTPRSRAEAAEALDRGSFDIADYALANDLPPVEVVARWILGSMVTDPDERRQAVQWISTYIHLQRNFQLLDPVARAAEAPAFINVMDTFVSQTASPARERFIERHPELRLLHNAWAAVELQESHPDTAAYYFQLAVSYYENELPQRRLNGTVDPFTMTGISEGHPTWLAFVNRDNLVDPGSLEGGLTEQLANYYESQGLHTIAEQYRQQSSA